MSIIANVGSLVPLADICTVPKLAQLKTSPIDVRDTKLIMSFLQNLRFDHYIGEFSVDSPYTSEFGVDGWKARPHTNSWDRDGEKRDAGDFDPRQVHFIKEGFDTVVYTCRRKIGGGTYGNVLEYTAVTSPPAGVPTSFALKIPSRKLSCPDSRDDEQKLEPEDMHEENVVNYLSEMGVFGETMCIVPYKLRTITVYAMERFDGDLGSLTWPHGISSVAAIKLAYSIFQDCKYVFEKTGLIHEDLKLQNCLYRLANPNKQDGVMTVSPADFGGFVPKGTSRGIVTYASPMNYGRTPYVADEKHLAFCLAVMIITASPHASGSVTFLRDSGSLTGLEYDNYISKMSKVEPSDIGHLSNAQVYLLDRLFGMKVDFRRFLLASDNTAVDSVEKIDALFLSFFETVDYSPPRYPSGHLPSSGREPAFAVWVDKYGYPDFDAALRVAKQTRKLIDGADARCHCECGCRNKRLKFDEDMVVVAPNTGKGRVYEHWAANNRTNRFFLVCHFCAGNFSNTGSHTHAP